MALLLGLAFIPKARKPLTDHGLVETQAKSNQNEESISKSIGTNTICYILYTGMTDY